MVWILGILLIQAFYTSCRTIQKQHHRLPEEPFPEQQILQDYSPILQQTPEGAGNLQHLLPGQVKPRKKDAPLTIILTTNLNKGKQDTNDVVYTVQALKNAADGSENNNHKNLENDSTESKEKHEINIEGHKEVSEVNTRQLVSRKGHTSDLLEKSNPNDHVTNIHNYFHNKHKRGRKTDGKNSIEIAVEKQAMLAIKPLIDILLNLPKVIRKRHKKHLKHRIHGIGEPNIRAQGADDNSSEEKVSDDLFEPQVQLHRPVLLKSGDEREKVPQNEYSFEERVALGISKDVQQAQAVLDTNLEERLPPEPLTFLQESTNSEEFLQLEPRFTSDVFKLDAGINTTVLSGYEDYVKINDHITPKGNEEYYPIRDVRVYPQSSTGNQVHSEPRSRFGSDSSEDDENNISDILNKSGEHGRKEHKNLSSEEKDEQSKVNSEIKHSFYAPDINKSDSKEHHDQSSRSSEEYGHIGHKSSKENSRKEDESSASKEDSNSKDQETGTDKDDKIQAKENNNNAHMKKLSDSYEVQSIDDQIKSSATDGDSNEDEKNVSGSNESKKGQDQSNEILEDSKNNEDKSSQSIGDVSQNDQDNSGQDKESHDIKGGQDSVESNSDLSKDSDAIPNSREKSSDSNRSEKVNDESKEASQEGSSNDSTNGKDKSNESVMEHREENQDKFSDSNESKKVSDESKESHQERSSNEGKASQTEEDHSDENKDILSNSNESKKNQDTSRESNQDKSSETTEANNKMNQEDSTDTNQDLSKVSNEITINEVKSSEFKEDHGEINQEKPSKSNESKKVSDKFEESNQEKSSNDSSLSKSGEDYSKIIQDKSSDSNKSIEGQDKSKESSQEKSKETNDGTDQEESIKSNQYLSKDSNETTSKDKSSEPKEDHSEENQNKSGDFKESKEAHDQSKENDDKNQSTSESDVNNKDQVESNNSSARNDPKYRITTAESIESLRKGSEEKANHSGEAPSEKNDEDSSHEGKSKFEHSESEATESSDGKNSDSKELSQNYDKDINQDNKQASEETAEKDSEREAESNDSKIIDRSGTREKHSEENKLEDFSHSEEHFIAVNSEELAKWEAKTMKHKKGKVITNLEENVDDSSIKMDSDSNESNHDVAKHSRSSDQPIRETESDLSFIKNDETQESSTSDSQFQVISLKEPVTLYEETAEESLARANNYEDILMNEPTTTYEDLRSTDGQETVEEILVTLDRNGNPVILQNSNLQEEDDTNYDDTSIDRINSNDVPLIKNEDYEKPNIADQFVSYDDFDIRQLPIERVDEGLPLGLNTEERDIVGQNGLYEVPIVIEPVDGPDYTSSNENSLERIGDYEGPILDDLRPTNQELENIVRENNIPNIVNLLLHEKDVNSLVRNDQQDNDNKIIIVTTPLKDDNCPDSNAKDEDPDIKSHIFDEHISGESDSNENIHEYHSLRHEILSEYDSLITNVEELTEDSKSDSSTTSKQEILKHKTPDISESISNDDSSNDSSSNDNSSNSKSDDIVIVHHNPHNKVSKASKQSNDSGSSDSSSASHESDSDDISKTKDSSDSTNSDSSDDDLSRNANQEKNNYSRESNQSLNSDILIMPIDKSDDNLDSDISVSLIDEINQNSRDLRILPINSLKSENSYQPQFKKHKNNVRESQETGGRLQNIDHNNNDPLEERQHNPEVSKTYNLSFVFNKK